MDIDSPIGKFLTVLQQVQKAAAQHANVLRNNEAATRAALIDPVLKALGWDTANPQMVEVERSFHSTRVDYALLDTGGMVRAVIEAKALGVNLNDPTILPALIKYAYTYKTKEIYLTDGLIWKHYTINAPGAVHSTEITLSSAPSMPEAEFLIHRLDAAQYWCQPPAATQATSVPAPQAAVPTPSNVPIPAPVVSTFTPLSTILQDQTHKPAPKQLCLPDGKVVSVHTWREMLLECCRFVLANNPSLPLPLPDRAGVTISLVSTQRPQHNVKFQSATYQGQTVYIFLNYSANDCLKNARHILSYLPAGKFPTEASVS